MDLKAFLQKEFGFTEFREGQKEILTAFSEGKNVLGVLATGTGKSLCYQWGAKLNEGLVLVVSPLISLMQDQAVKAQEFKIQSVYINSLLSREEKEKRYQNLRTKKYQMIFVTPERFKNPQFMEALAVNPVRLLVVDEAHCISAWGHEFRPDYGQLSRFIDKIKPQQIMALTATATPEVIKDIQAQLGHDLQSVVLSPVRLNLHFSMVDCVDDEEKTEKLLEHLKTGEGTQIVYFSLIQSLYSVSKILEKKKIAHIIYHGDLPASEKKKKLKTFQEQKDILVLATPAFGLGIDKSNIRQIIHFETPGSLEAYVQEAGRAGRDGEDSECILLYDQNDLLKQMEFIKWATPDLEYVRTLFKILETKSDQVKMEGLEFIKEQMTFKTKHDYRVETTLQLLQSWDLLVEDDSPFGYELVGKWDDSYFKKYQRGEREKTLHQKLHKLVEYTKTKDCRQKFIGQYFGFPQQQDCEQCDNCQN